MTIVISNCDSSQLNLITETIYQRAEELNIIPRILAHNIDQQVTIEVSGGIAEDTFVSDGVEVEIIDHDNEESNP